MLARTLITNADRETGDSGVRRPDASPSCADTIGPVTRSAEAALKATYTITTRQGPTRARASSTRS